MTGPAGGERPAGSPEPDGTDPASGPEPDGTDPAGGPEPEVLDCRGQRCPLPVIALARRLPALPVGSVLRVLADDPAAGPDIAAWCRMRGQEFLGSPRPDAFDVRRAG